LNLLAWISARDKTHIVLFKIRISIPPGGTVSRLLHMLGGLKPELTLSPALAGTMLVSSLLSRSNVWILWMTTIMCIYISRLAHWEWIPIPWLGC
ncbi:hypothetical protein PISMIDRAFT_688267, partial [Pisolithus microcarpus 441]